MNREIKFRAKGITDGKWHYGYIYEHKPPIQCFHKDTPDPSEWYIHKSGFADWNMQRPVEQIQVDPKTIGQFTGLSDKEGSHIYEGDILQLDKRSTSIGVVVFDGDAFKVTMPAFKIFWKLLHKRTSRINLPVVIGNVTDNPNLVS